MTSERIAEYLARPYSKVLMRDEAGGYVAQLLEFPGCIAEGESPDEAIQGLDEAMEDWIEEVLNAGKPVPEPIEALGYSGRLVLRLPKWVHKQAARRAQADAVSLNQWIVEAVGERLGAENYAERLCQRIIPTLTGRVVAFHGGSYGMVMWTPMTSSGFMSLPEYKPEFISSQKTQVLQSTRGL